MLLPSRLTLSLSTAPLIFPISSTAWAQDPEVAVVVTATGIEEPTSRVGDSITVLQPDDIRASQLVVASDLLSRTPGVAVSRNGGVGGTTALRIRGAESDQTVVLFDGVKLNDPSSTGSGYDFANLLLDDEARIEVLRGPQSVRWGSQAIGGVVNIITPAPTGPLSTMLRAELGELDTGFVRGRIESGGERLAWRLGANYYTTKGVSAFDEDLGGREADGYRNVGADFSATYRVTDSVSAEIRARYSDADDDFDGFPPPSYEFADTSEHGQTQELVSYAALKLAPDGSRWTHQLGFAYTDTDRENFNPDQEVTTATFRANGHNKRVEYLGTYEINPAYRLSFGAQSERSDFTAAAPSSFDPHPATIGDEVTLNSLFAQLQATPLEPLSLTLGARYDDHDTFGTSTTVRGALAWSVTHSTLLRASYGEGFKAPSLYQLFSEYGNTSLRPEESNGWDAGVEQHLANDKVVLSATYFERDTDDMIDFFSCFGSADPRCGAQPFGFYENIARTRARGVELTFKAELLDNLHLNANYTALDAENAAHDSPNFGLDLPRRADYTFYADLAFTWPAALTSSVAVQRIGPGFDDPYNTIALDAYTLVDLRMNYDVSKRLSVYARVENLFDEDYSTTAHYGSVGRAAYGGIRLNF